MDINDQSTIDLICKKLLDLRVQILRPVVFITGLSGSGKTTLANKIHENNNKIKIVSFDWWIKDSSPVRRAKIVSDYEQTGNIPNPLEWYSWDKFRNDISTLQSSGSLNFENAWNQSSGEKDLDLHINIADDEIIVIEGMYLFEDLTKDLADYIVMIEPDIDSATERSQARHQNRNPGEYLAIKERWHREYDVPYLNKNVNLVDLLLKNNPS